MNNAINWLANYYDTSIVNIYDLLNSERATTFLLIWPIFENELFNGYCRKGLLASKIKDIVSVFNDDIEKMAKHFHDRYHNNKRYYHNLIHNDKYDDFSSIISNEYETLDNESKLLMLLYIVFRYRNNIFHGNKGILSWTKYGKQIDYCIDFMTLCLDSVKNKE